MFHHNPNISGGGWDDRYQVQYHTLFDLADLNQENVTIDAYLKDAAKLFQQHGVDAFRIDAMKHVTWGWEYCLANSIYSNGDSFLFGEWYQGNTSDPLFHDSYKFANKSGMALLDFPLNTAGIQFTTLTAVLETVEKRRHHRLQRLCENSEIPPTGSWWMVQIQPTKG